MGHASSISAGLAISTPSRRIFCLDGDGALQMHMGSAATIGEVSPKNLFHFVFNNGTHDSVGGQSVTAPSIDYQTLFRSFGYRHRFKASNTGELEKLLLFCNQNDGPIFVEVKIQTGDSGNLPRPTNSPLSAKIKFQRLLSHD
jgi:phosphonopyruvate decarboxylase